MKAQVRVCAVLLLAAAAAFAQPVVGATGMVNSASFVPMGLPSGDIAQGSMFSIYGQHMGPATAVFATLPLPATQGLGGVTVQVTDSAGKTIYAILFFVRADQINAILPSAVATGRATLKVTYNGVASQPQSFNVTKSSFGIFAKNSQGSGPGIVFNYHPTAVANDITSSAVPNDVGVLWGTGLGPVDFDETTTPTQKDLGMGAEVWVGGQRVTVQYQGRGPFAGEDQINFVVPNITGCYVPVFVKIGNIVSNTVSMAIGPNGGKCSDQFAFAGLDPAYDLKNGLSEGSVSLSRTLTKGLSIGGFSLPDSTSDGGFGDFHRYDWARLQMTHGQFGVSTYGACTVMTFRGDQASSADPVKPDYLDAGNLSLVGPDGATKQFTVTSKGNYSVDLGKGTYLTAGNYTLTGAGGADVGAFTSTLTLPQPFVWSNVDSITQVTRASGVTVNWTGGAGLVSIMGFSMITSPQDTGAMFICIEQASKLAFTVPPAVLLALPPSGSNGVGALVVSNAPVSVNFNPMPRGLNLGTFSASFETFKMVGYN